MPGKHARDPGYQPRRRIPAVIDMVDVTSHLTHLMTPDALDAGRRPHGRYLALCGDLVLPAALVDPGKGYCLPCRQPLLQTNARPTRRPWTTWWKRTRGAGDLR